MKERHGWFDTQKNRNLFLRLFYGCLVALLVLDLFVEKHAYFGFDGVPGFSAAYGFVACVVLALAAKLLRMVLLRDEEYYR
jgi:hypothetical protein